jgi:hypothetical protein
VDAQQLGTARAVALGTAARIVVPISVATGRCLEVLAALDGAASGLELRLADEASGKVEVELGEVLVAGRLCAPSEPKRGRVELRATRTEARGLMLQRSIAAPAHGEPR